MERTSKFTSTRVYGSPLQGVEKHKDVKVWFCDIGAPAKMLSSEELAKKMDKLMASGTSKWRIIVGPHDGFSKKDYERLQPEFSWSFGPLTFPHELAAVVASEQIYRAWTILRSHPYHGGHFKK